MNNKNKADDSEQNERATDEQKVIFQEATKKLAEMAVQLTQTRCVWIRHLLFLTVTLFGILISLHTNTKSSHAIQWCFALAIVLLLLSTLAGSISAYSEIGYQSQARKMYLESALKAFHGGGKIGHTIVPPNKLSVISEIVFYTSSICGILVLTLYALLINFAI
jgi:hypothetical protein